MTRHQQLLFRGLSGVLLCGVVLAALSYSLFADEDKQEVQWQTDIEKTLASVKDKPLVVLFYAEWCPHCKKLKAEVFSSPEFQKYANRAVFLKIEAGNEEPMANALREKLDVKGFPVLEVLVSRGDLNFHREGSITGGFPLKDYLTRLDALLDFADKDELAPAVGEFSSPSSTCTAGDPACTEAPAEDVKASPLLIESLQKAAAALQGLAEEKKDIAGISKLLEEAGYQPDAASADQKWRDVKVVDEQGWTYYIRISLSENLEQVWVMATLLANVDVENASASQLLSLMRLNSSSGRGFTAINDSNTLTISVALDNDGISAKRLKSAINDLTYITRTTYPEWSKLQTKPAAAQ